jgi:hypothetical protein
VSFRNSCRPARRSFAFSTRKPPVSAARACIASRVASSLCRRIASIDPNVVGRARVRLEAAIPGAVATRPRVSSA